MKIINGLAPEELARFLKNGDIAVIPTDTIYGIVGQINNKLAVEKIYELKGRNKDKPFIVLISDLSNLESLGIKLDENSKKIIEKYWPGKVSIVFPRTNGTVAVRLPDFQELRSLIEKTGPLVAPSANPEGLPPAQNINEAVKYFGDKVNYYVDGGELNSSPSTLIKLDGGKIVVLREGAVTIDESDQAS